MQGGRRRRRIRCLAAAAALAAAPAGAEDAFSIREIAEPGRTVLAEIRDLDGDDRGDLLSVVFTGLPPSDTREIQIRYQRADGALPEAPDWKMPLPRGSAAYDLLEREGRPTELLLLGREGVTRLSFTERALARRMIAVPDPLFPVAQDDRGLDRLRIVAYDLDDAPRLVLPGLGEGLILDLDGAILGRPEVGGRANYFIPPRPGPIISESEAELYLDHPRMATGDVNGDGRADVVASGRHEVRVFFQRADGRFPTAPDRRLVLGRIEEPDHIRGSGSVQVDVRDVDVDGRVDLLMTHASGGIFEAKSVTSLHLNRDGAWDLGKPDQTFRTKGSVATDRLIDLDGDGRPELMHARIPLSVMEMVEILVTSALDVRAEIFRGGEDGIFEEKPWIEQKYGVAFDFETFRPRGFIPSLDEDLNDDGYPDLLSSADGDALEVYLGGPERRLKKRSSRQKLPTSGRVRFGHYDADGLPDFVLYDPRQSGREVRVGVNLGTLPDTRRAPQVAPAAKP